MVTRTLVTDYLRGEFSPGNLNPNSKFVPLQLLFNNLFYTDRPNHTIFATPEDITYIVTIAARKRGVRVVNYDLFYTDLGHDTNIRANETAYFLGSMDEPFQPYIIATSTKNMVFNHYLKKFGMTTFSYNGYYDEICDYHIGKEDLTNVVTRTSYVQPASELSYDFQVIPDVDQDSFERYLITAALHLESILHTTVKPCANTSALTRNGLTTSLDYCNEMFDDRSYFMSTFEGFALIPKQSFTFDKRRKFVVAPSGSGKTIWCRTHPDWVDADTIFTFPQKKLWWMDESLASTVNDDNRAKILEWLSAEDDGKIITYADTLGLLPDCAVRISDELWKYNLSHDRPGQPGLSDFAELLSGFLHMEAKHQDLRVFSSFSYAQSFLRAQGRNAFARRNRFSWMYSFHVSDIYVTAWNIQTYISSQTWIVKSITYTLAKTLLFNGDDMEKPRRLALTHLGCVVLGGYDSNFRISGAVRYRGKVILLTPAGHMVNYIILSSIIKLDWNRFFKQLEWNLELYCTKRKLTNIEKLYGKNEFFAESTTLKNIYSMWHNVIEWTVGAVAGYFFSLYLGIEVNLELVNLVISKLHSLGKKYPKSFTQSIVVQRLVDEGEFNPSSDDLRALGSAKEWLPVAELNL